MKNILLITAMMITRNALAIELIKPEVHRFESIQISSPDGQIATLGAVEFILDLSASKDDLIELKARRKKLTLKNGTALSTFGYSKEAGVIIGSIDPITQIRVREGESGLLFALFHNDQNEVIIPRQDQIQLFDLKSFKPIEFDYKPLSHPSDSSINVDLMIDVSGSMKDALPKVRFATRDFMNGLPTFTRCSVFKFNHIVESLTSMARPCPFISGTLPPLKADGATALKAALWGSLERHEKRKAKHPAITIVITDGKDTENPEITMQKLIDLKAHSNSKILVFWAGSYDPQYLKGLADIEVTSNTNIENDLQRFFTNIGISINGMQAIKLK